MGDNKKNTEIVVKSNNWLSALNVIGSIASVIALVVTIIQMTVQPNGDINNHYETANFIWRIILCIICIFSASAVIFVFSYKIVKIKNRDIDAEKKAIYISFIGIICVLILGLFVDGMYSSITNIYWLPLRIFI